MERVRLGTATVTEQRNVTGEVRKEQIEVKDETDPAARPGKPLTPLGGCQLRRRAMVIR